MAAQSRGQGRRYASAAGYDCSSPRLDLVDRLLDAPAFPVVAFTLASALLLVEAALPTAGLAGLSGLALAVAGMVAVDRQEEAWWPLGLIALAVGLWGFLLLRRSLSVPGRMTAAGLHAAGGVGYGILAADILAVVVAAAAAMGLSAGYPPLRAAMSRLLDRGPQVGMEALVGRVGVVERADGRRGTVRVDGEQWQAEATSGHLPAAGRQIRVIGFRGLTLFVE
jgi:membrane-bound ClpP family serine protease